MGKVREGRERQQEKNYKGYIFDLILLDCVFRLIVFATDIDILRFINTLVQK